MDGAQNWPAVDCPVSCARLYRTQATALARHSPLVALGPDRYLVDGYARLHAVRLLEVAEVEVVVQCTT